MVIAYHAIFTAYGFWLPNDPRGSWSEWIREWELLRFGPATKAQTRRSVAGDEHDVRQRMEAKEALRYLPVSFTGRQAVAIANGFAAAAAKSKYIIHACAILPQHVHVVLARHGEHTVEQMVSHLKGGASRALAECGMHPFTEHRKKDGSLPSMWARNFWKVFLNDEVNVRAAMEYIRQNPLKEGKREQHWPFVEPFQF